MAGDGVLRVDTEEPAGGGLWPGFQLWFGHWLWLWTGSDMVRGSYVEDIAGWQGSIVAGRG